MKTVFILSLVTAVLLAAWACSLSRQQTNPYYAATLQAAEYRSRPDCGQPGQPNTPNPCADENVLKVLQVADDTAILFQTLVVQIGADPSVTPEARRAAIIWAEHSAKAFKETVSSIAKTSVIRSLVVVPPTTGDPP